MKNDIQLLQVSYNKQNVGKLAMGDKAKCLFEYDSAWLKTGFSISPFFLPLKTGVFVAKHEPFNGLFGVFNDSMPDGWGNLLLDRFLSSKGINIEALTVIDRLAFVGKSGMGALSYQPDNSEIYRMRSPDLNSIAKQVSDILSERADIPTIKSILKLTGSSGGARPKVLINHMNATWMVKFASSNDDRNIGKQEYFYSELAEKCGIEMSETKLFENNYFGTRLFDRNQDERFHVHSASGLLDASHRFPSLDYTQLAKATLALTKNTNELIKLLRLMVFNVAIENKDDHAKNFSYIFKNENWNLSPAYDLLKSEGFANEHATAIAGVGNPNRKDMMKVASEIKFSEKQMKNIIENVFDICLSSKIGEALRKRNL